MLPFVQAEEPSTVEASIVRGITPPYISYVPDPIFAKVGDTVRWTNNDATLHTVISGFPVSPDGKFGLNEDGGPIYIPPAGTFEHVFEEAGEFPYFCNLHPFMTSKVIVGDTRSPPYSIAVSTDKSFYESGETVLVSGKVQDAEEGSQALIQILNPNGAAYRLELVPLEDDGTFSYSFTINGPLGISGMYRVAASYGDLPAYTSFYFQAPQFHLTIHAHSQDGSALNMWAAVITQITSSGYAGVSSFTPTSIQLDAGKTYSVTVADYLDSKFSRWEDGSTSRTRTIELSANTTLTAYYESGKSIRGFTSLTYYGPDEEPDLTVNAVSLDGEALYMWTRIQSVEKSESGTTYAVTVSDYSAYYFDHWEDGSTDRTRVLTTGEDKEITAFYRTLTYG